MACGKDWVWKIWDTFNRMQNLIRDILTYVDDEEVVDKICSFFYGRDPNLNVIKYKPIYQEAGISEIQHSINPVFFTSTFGKELY